MGKKATRRESKSNKQADPTKTPGAASTSTKKAVSKKALSKKAVSKKAVSKKAVSKKALSKKAVSKKAASDTPSRTAMRGAASARKKAAKVSSKTRPHGNKPTTIDEYLLQVDEDTRALLQRLRETIHELVPDLVECISYSLPAFRHKGKVIAGFIATKTGGSYLPFSGTTLGSLSKELADYSQTKSSLHFTAEKPLPKSLVNTLLRTRIAEL